MQSLPPPPRKLILVLAFCCYSAILLAQPNCDTTPAICTNNLKQPLYGAIDTRMSISYSKTPLPASFLDVAYSLEEDCSITDGCINDAGALVYDVYFPKNHNYTDCPLPALIFFHPGGFSDCSDRFGPFMDTVCYEFAKRGFVVFNVEYRRGRIKDQLQPTKYTSVQQQLAAYRACQDGRGAVRSIIKRERNRNNFNDPYSIDTNKIFVGGASAGGVIAMITSWYSNPMVYAAFPSVSAQNIQNVLGPINADYYYGDSTYNYKPRILGNLCMWGSVPIPNNPPNTELDFFVNGNAIVKPVIAFHGKEDKVFPFNNSTNEQEVNFSLTTNTVNNSESGCLRPGKGPFTLEGNSNTVELLRGSSLNIYNIAKSTAFNKPAELNVDCTMKHGLDPSGPDFHSDFGTGLMTSGSTTKYMVQRAATFFQAIMNGIAGSLIKSVFIETENNRKGCSTSDNFTVGDDDSCNLDD